MASIVFTQPLFAVYVKCGAMYTLSQMTLAIMLHGLQCAFAEELRPAIASAIQVEFWIVPIHYVDG